MIIERILHFVDYKGLTKSKFYKETNLSNGFLDKNRDFGVSKLVNILKTYPELNPNWVLMGQKPMIKIRENSNKVKEPVPVYEKDNYLINLQKKHIQKLEEEIELLKRKQKKATHYK